MHLGATVQHRLLIVQILLKPENSRKPKTAAKPFAQAAELNATSRTPAVMKYKSVELLGQYFY